MSVLQNQRHTLPAGDAIPLSEITEENNKFQVENERAVYMKTDDVNDDGTILCVTLHNGMTFGFEPTEMVYPCRVLIQIVR